MMTCPRRSDAHRATQEPARFRRGFTLIEIVVALMIIAVITGGSIAAMLANSSERKLRSASSEVELLAKKARTASILNQTPYALEFHQGLIRLAPFSEVAETGRKTVLGNEIGGVAADQGTERPVRDETTIDPEINLSIRRWNTTGFLSTDKDDAFIWRFDPDGLSEPITVRFELGGSYAQDTYHPLTASIADSELEAN